MKNIDERLSNQKNDQVTDDYFEKMTDDEKIDFVAERILRLYRPAFEELAK